jgi:hypothetical protein
LPVPLSSWRPDARIDVNQGAARDAGLCGCRCVLVEAMNPREWLQDMVAGISDADVASVAVSILLSATVVSVLQTIFS